jgi:hypothetical protein
MDLDGRGGDGRGKGKDAMFGCKGKGQWVSPNEKVHSILSSRKLGAKLEKLTEAKGGIVPDQLARVLSSDTNVVGGSRRACSSPVTLGLRGGHRRLKHDETPGTKAGEGDAVRQGGGVRAGENTVEDQDAFAGMSPSQARAAKIRRERAIVAKAIAEKRMAERAARHQQEEIHVATASLSKPAEHKQRDSRATEGTAPAVQLSHGQHFPQGYQCVEYAYSEEGTWKRLGQLHYEHNMFEEHATDNQPFDRESLEGKCTTQQHTCCDSDGNILCDPKRVGQPDQSSGSDRFAFQRSNGLAATGGNKGKRLARPCLLFTFDENLLGHCISQIYSKPAPAGLEADSVDKMNMTFSRWQPLIKSTCRRPVSPAMSDTWLARVEALWKGNSKIERAALKGLYHVINRNMSGAFLVWQWLRDVAGVEYDGSVFHFVYNRLTRTSDIALFRILTVSLLACDDENGNLMSGAWRSELVDNAVALRMVLLSSVVDTCWIGPSPSMSMPLKGGVRTATRKPGAFKGWASGWAESCDGLSMASGCVESGATFLATIALGACCSLAFEAGSSPLVMEDKGYIQRYHVLTASHLKNNGAGLMVGGPFWNMPIGHYRLAYYIRARAPHHTATSTNDKMELPPGQVCTLEVRDANSSARQYAEVLFSRVLQPSDFGTGNHWSRFVCDFCLLNPLNALDLRLEWHGNATLDVTSITLTSLV